MQSDAIRSAIREVLRGTQRSSVGLSGPQWDSVVLRGPPTPSDALASRAPSGERRRRAAEAASEFVRFMLDLMG